MAERISNYEMNRRQKLRRVRHRGPDPARRTHSILLSSHGCIWAADNLSILLQKEGMNAAVVRKPRRCDLKIMVGWYVNNCSEESHRAELITASRRVVWWVGTDILWLEAKKPGPDHPSIRWLNSHGVEHWAEWEHSAARLRACGLANVRVVHMPARRRFSPLPLPPEFCAGVYCYDSRQAFYGIELVRAAARLSPEIRWLVYPRYRSSKAGNIEYMARVDAARMDEVYGRQSVHVRVVASDGMPQGPMEAMMCARPVIYNFQPLDHAVYLPKPTPQSLVAVLRRLKTEQARGEGYNLAGATYWREKNDPKRLIREINRILNQG